MSISKPHNPNPKSFDWITPKLIIERLGPFDLDPCASVKQPWPTAERHLTILDDGLNSPWKGRVWLNPPYGNHTASWMRRLAIHGDGMALIMARTETKIFFPWIWDYADALLFLKGRITFFYPDGTKATGNAGAPSVLVAYGSQNAMKLYTSEINGHYIINSSSVRSGASRLKQEVLFA